MNNKIPLQPDLHIASVNAQPFRHGSLFSGIGGFDLAAEWMGWENVFHCEWNEFGQKILKYYWPNAISYGDITKTDFTIHRGNIDILTGGFPCQPYSHAGKRLGKEDERHLWPEMLRAIREISPRWIVGENVSGLTNWNGGLVFNEVQSDLEAEGYEILPVLLPAASIGAPHKRERIWFIADSSKIRRGKHKPRRATIITEETSEKRNFTNSANTRIENVQQWKNGIHEPDLITNTEKSRWNDNSIKTISGRRGSRTFGIQNCKHNAANAGCGFGENGIHGKEQGRETTEFGDSYTKFGRFEKFPVTEPTICRGNDGFSTELDGITFPKWRNESIKAYGNAIVPQVVYQIFKAIEAYRLQYGWR